MLNNKQIRLLQLLDKKVGNCNLCALRNGGRCIPSWNKNVKYAIIGQSPNYSDIRRQTFFNGRSGDILTTELANNGFKASQFLMINSVQCMTVGSNRPTSEQLNICKEYIRKYIRIINPEKILCLGNYAKYIFTGDTMGTLRRRGKFRNFSFDEDDYIEYPVLFTINPSYCIYNEEDGLRMLREDIKLFKETDFERKSDWMFSKEDFLII